MANPGGYTRLPRYINSEDDEPTYRPRRTTFEDDRRGFEKIGRSRNKSPTPPLRSRYETKPIIRQENNPIERVSQKQPVVIPKVPQVITTWKSRFIKAYMLIMGIVIVTTGLFMIDESCGCIRKEDKLLSWALKLYVFLGIIMLVLGLFFSTETKKLYIGYCTAFVVVSCITLALNSWIIKKAKEMFESMITGENTTCRGKKDDSRFLSYSIVGITVLSVSVFTSIMLLLWVIYRSTKSVYTSYDLENVKKMVINADIYKKEMNKFKGKLDTINGLTENQESTFKALRDAVKKDIEDLEKVQSKADEVIKCMNQIFINPDDVRCKKSKADPLINEINNIFVKHKKVDERVLDAKLKYSTLRQ